MYFQGATVQFVANRNCEINGYDINEYDMITVKLRRNWDTNEGKSQDGSWGWGEYTTEKLLEIAEEILMEDDIIYQKAFGNMTTTEFRELVRFCHSEDNKL